MKMFLKLAAVTMALAATLAANAAEQVWTNSLGDWSNPINWSTAVPAAGDVANISNGGTAIVTTPTAVLAECWDGNFGGQGMLIVTNGGVLNVNGWLVVARMCCPSPTITPPSFLYVNGGTVNKSGSGFIIGDSGGNLGSLGTVVVAGNSVVNVTGGWNGIGNGNGSGWLYLQDNAVFNTPAYDFNVADYGNGRGWCYISGNATLNASRFWIGKTDTTAGALWQTGGAINGTGTAANEWTIGGENNVSPDSYGFYSLAAGTMNNPFNFQIGRYGKGVVYQTGGTNTQGSWTSLARMVNSLGTMWVSGGTYQHIGTTTHTIVAEEGRGELTVSGTGVADFALSLVLGNNAAASGYMNVNNGGTVRVPRFERWNGAGYLNLNGGVVQAKASDTGFMAGLSEARVYPGNAVFDTAGYDISINQNLLGATGQGVMSIPIANGGAGYIGAPIVQIDGDGSGALAVAQIDPGAGTVTNIVVTCPGHDYTQVFSVSFVGGAPATPATAGTPVFGSVSTGGVVKNGAGTLTLLGNNSYAGPTVVNAGKVAAIPTQLGFGQCNVANGAGFGVKLNDAGTQVNATGLTLGASSVNFDLGALGNPIVAPLSISGALTANGTVTINIADSFPQVGTFTLIEYASRAGAGNFVLGTMPTGVQASLVDNTANKRIELVITAVNLPRWNGDAGGFWDISLTANWTDVGSGLASFYGEGNAVLFDDYALGVTSVDIIANVHPASVTVNNTNLAYTFTGTNKISGATGLLKQGTNTLTIANALNDYTGPNRILGGSVIVTNLANGGQPSAIGKSSSSPTNLVLNGGTLTYAGPAAATDRGYSVQGPGAAIDVQTGLTVKGIVTAPVVGGFLKRGPGTLTYQTAGTNELSGGSFPGYHVVAGTVVFDGTSGYQTNHSQNEFWIGGTPDFPASMVLSNTSLKVDSWIGLGRGNGTVGNVSTLKLSNAQLWTGNFSMGYDNGISGNLASQTLTLLGTSTLTNSGDSNLGESAGSTSSIFLNDNSVYYAGQRLFVGWHSGGTAALTLANSSVMFVNAWLSIGNEGGTGTLTVKDNAKLGLLWDLNVTDVNTGDGTFNLQGNAQVEANQVYVAKGPGSTGTFNQSGGTITARGGGANEFHIGSHGAGVWNQTGGTVNANGNWTSIGRFSDGPGVLNISGGLFSHNDPTRWLQVGEEGAGELNVSGSGVVSTVGDRLLLANRGNASGIVRLNGGTIITRRVLGGAGTGGSEFDFNGGVLFAGPAANTDFISGLTSAFVNAGGAIIDSSSNNIAIAQPLEQGSGTGGLTKLGSGTLYINGTNSYVGATLVNAGALGGNGVIAGPVTVSSGAALAPGFGVGALSISNTLTLASGSTTVMELNKTAGTNDLVQGVTTLTYGGTLVISNISGSLAVNDTFKLFSAGSYSGSFTSIVSRSPLQNATWDTSRLAIDGTVKVTAVSSTGSPTVGTSVDAGRNNLTITWPTDYIGWHLLVQTNKLSSGISGNPLDWGTVPNSASTNRVILPIDKAKPTEFYKLVSQ